MTRKELLRWLAIFALLTLFSSGRWALWPVAWIAPIVGLYVIHRTSPRAGFFLLWAAIYLPSSIAWYGTIPFPAPVYAVFMLFNALVATAPYLLDRLLTRRLDQHVATTLVFPMATTAVEFLYLANGALGSFGAQAYTQSAFAPLAQFASVAGLWGITFVVTWFASIAHWVVRRHEAGQAYVRPVTMCGAIIAAILAFGAIRLLAAPAPQRSVQVTSFTAAHVDMGAMMSLYNADPAAFRERTREQHAAYLRRTAEAAGNGAQIVLWPELAGLGLADDVATLVSQGQALANEHDLYLAMPLFVLDPAGAAAPVNKILVADPAGAIVLEHVKYGGNLLEAYRQPGVPQLKTVKTPFGILSAVICWDTDYPAVVRQAGQQNVDILLSPASVWPAVARIHAEMAPFRAIENGLTLVRQSDNGFSLVSDPYGRVVMRENHVGQADVRMFAAAPVMPTGTLYTTLGDIVGQLSVAGILVTIIAVITMRFRQRTGGLRAADAHAG
jgi:apolipoprotein N-acyltransferase